MPDNSTNNKRIAKNTLVLYGRMLITVGISFYTTRIVLANLGIYDYGIYNVIGGFVNMFYIFTASLTAAVGRFLTYALGKGDENELQKVFSDSVYIMLGLSFLICLIAETVGLWFVNNQLVIPNERMVAANWIYQFTIVMFMMEMLSVPFSASVISHEKMKVFAFVTIIKVLLCFFAAILLSIAPFDKLITYGVSMLLVSISILVLYYMYCKKHFAECHVVGISGKVFKDIFNYTSWDFFSSSCFLLNNQGISILFNIFFGPAVNAAQGVASQVRGTAKSFANNFTTALSPQITKSYASNNIEYSKDLVCQGAKFCYLLLYIVALPIMLETDFVLSIWLADVPFYASSFIRLYLAYALVDMLVDTSHVLNCAMGRIRNYKIVIGVSQIFILALSFVILKIGASPVLVMLVNNIVAIIMVVPRITMNRKYIGITFVYFMNTVLLRVLCVTIISVIPCLLIIHYLEESWMRFLISSLLSVLMTALATYYIALNKAQREKVCEIAYSKIKNIKA